MTVDPIGGVWTYALELAAALRSKDVHFAFASMGAPVSSEQRLAAESLGNVDLFESHYKLEWMNEPWEDIDSAGGWLLDLEEQIEPDLIHLNGYSHATLPWHKPTIVVAHSCVLSWWNAVKRTELPPAWNAYRARVSAGLASATLIVAPSWAMAEQLGYLYGCCDVLVIPNGRDPALFSPEKKEPIILSAGRLWDEAKNIAEVAKIAAFVKWPIYIAGESAPPGSPETVAKSPCYLGRLEPKDLSTWLSKSAIYTLPAYYEPFGLSVLEAGLSGCALVIGDIPSLRENWNGAALFVPSDSQEELSRTINELISSPRLLQEMGTRARLRAIRFTAQAMGERYCRAYEFAVSQTLKEELCEY